MEFAFYLTDIYIKKMLINETYSTIRKVLK